MCQIFDLQNYLFYDIAGAQECANLVFENPKCSDTFFYSYELWECGCLPVHSTCTIIDPDPDLFPGMTIYNVLHSNLFLKFILCTKS